MHTGMHAEVHAENHAEANPEIHAEKRAGTCAGAHAEVHARVPAGRELVHMRNVPGHEGEFMHFELGKPGLARRDSQHAAGHVRFEWGDRRTSEKFGNCALRSYI